MYLNLFKRTWIPLDLLADLLALEQSDVYVVTITNHRMKLSSQTANIRMVKSIDIMYAGEHHIVEIDGCIKQSSYTFNRIAKLIDAIDCKIVSKPQIKNAKREIHPIEDISFTEHQVVLLINDIPRDKREDICDFILNLAKDDIPASLTIDFRKCSKEQLNSYFSIISLTKK